MEKSKLHHVLFTLGMAFVMVYAMICYNIALHTGQMSNAVFMMAFHELWIMWPIAIIIELFFVEKWAVKLAIKKFHPEQTSPQLFSNDYLYNDCLSDVSNYEFYCYSIVSKCWDTDDCSVVTDNGF